MSKFEEELTQLINKHCIENICDMPDFILSKMLCRIITSIGGPMKENLDWHGVDSVCHTKKERNLNDGCGKKCNWGFADQFVCNSNKKCFDCEWKIKNDDNCVTSDVNVGVSETKERNRGKEGIK